MDFVEFKVQNIQNEINDLNKYLLRLKTNKSENNNNLVNNIKNNEIIENKLNNKDKKLKQKNENKNESKNNNNNNSEKKSWAEIMDEDEQSLFVKYQTLLDEVNKLRQNFDRLFQYNKINKKAKND